MQEPLDPKEKSELEPVAENKEETAPPRKRNWATDIYDKINVSVRTLDILIVVLCALIVFLFVFGNKIQLGIG
ncbi:MAG TPA: hypothetical protein IAC19_02025 [Candidatus Ventricola gallistercoris]|nr:hypothetical protein [Candidatus Ventricola gallistercoris]